MGHVPVCFPPAGAQRVSLQQQSVSGQTETQQRAQRPVAHPPQSPEERLLQPQTETLQRARWENQNFALCFNHVLK